MNDRCEGALEALSYIKQFIGDLDEKKGLKTASKESDYLISLLLKGSVSDFRHRITQY